MGLFKRGQPLDYVARVCGGGGLHKRHGLETLLLQCF